MSEAAHPIAVTSGRLRLLKALALIIMLVSVVHDGMYVLTGLPFDKGLSTLGLSAGAAVDKGYIQVDGVTPDGAAEAAGIRTGDWVRFDRPSDAYRGRVAPGERFEVSVRADEGVRKVQLVAPPSRANSLRVETILSGATNILLALAGGLIALRSPRLSGVVLGAALGAMGLVGTYTFLWENHPALQIPLILLFSVIMSASPVLLIAFALMMRREAFGRPVGVPWRVMLWVYAGAQLATLVVQSWVSLAFTTLPLLGDGFLVNVLSQWAGFLIALVVLGLGWREATGAERTRFGFLFVALTLLFMAGSGVGLLINLTGNDFSLGNPLAVASHVFMAGGIAAFLYASLRHKVVDMGFAVNRTLVFGALSTALLFAFFFAEWGAEQVIPAEMREASLLASAGIAFALFLVFHKIRDWVEKGVETVFFRRWRDNEAELRRFVRQAAFVTRPDALRQSTVTAFSRFAGGADVALYSQATTGYELSAGIVPGLPTAPDPDLQLLVRLRADREALEDELPLGVALALPTLHRNELSGFFVLGPKPGGELYRPDEIEALAEAALRIGLDLHALRVEALEAESREQRQRAELLEQQVQRALMAGAARA
ncbi:hypothetical protein [Brevundimonas lenta]|uniref:Uncharacterized protein n=1 Tax=Brevundimonas lenta TaxID=424796 RepID=A0A7W6JC29_9CAUL|nr:hypothetical protein [Brevundimonas lenta]MBB4082359.1 hypothetical protein [Brevundimonas lenta]